MKPREYDFRTWAISNDGKVHILNASWSWEKSKQYFREYCCQDSWHVIEKCYADEMQKYADELEAKLKQAVEQIERAIDAMEYWSREIENWNVPPEFHAKRLLEVAKLHNEELKKMRGEV